jgi:hypothetical protein
MIESGRDASSIDFVDGGGAEGSTSIAIRRVEKRLRREGGLFRRRGLRGSIGLLSRGGARRTDG